MSLDWQRIKQVLSEAATRGSAAEQTAYLDEACRDDAPLRAEVEKLLRAHAQAAGFLENASLPPAEQPLSERAGDKIGLYKLLQQIGEGGCGVVYMAEQEEPIRRRVALKIIKLGMDTKAVIARFEAERQALALMDHPNIARVLDAGATETGRPYFVMELVRGIRITDYCDQNQLSTEQRLNLFTHVCYALQHAHQKGIIHRDIKPSNILVTVNDGVPMPKVIDFGIAKAIDQRLTEKTLFTAFEQFIGTPAYMSPEQAQMSSVDIDTRSDVYSLGVLLYELLTAHTPFEHRELLAAGLDEMRKMIREQEPKRPSTRLSGLAVADQTTVARCRQTDPPQLIRSIRGDIDWIVMRCLEKDRTRRYETANSLAEDIARHLNNEPVRARPPSRCYLFRKLVQRNKVACGAGTLIALALVSGLGFSLWTLGKERAARRQASAAEQKVQVEAAKSQQVARFLRNMLQGVGPSVALGRDTTMLREILDKTAERVGNDLKGQPEVEAELRVTLGEVYEALGQYDQAETMYRAALSLRRSLHGNMHTNVADALDLLGHELTACRGENEEGPALLREALMIRTNLLGCQHVQVAASLHHLGVISNLDKPDEQDALLERALVIRRQLLGNSHAQVAESLTALANSMTWQARQDEAEAYAREALAVLSRLAPGETAPQTVAFAQAALGVILLRQGKFEEAISLQRSAVGTIKELVGEAHPTYAASLYNLGFALNDANQLEEAVAVMQEALAILKTAGNQDQKTRECLRQLAGLAEKRGRLAEAEALYRQAHPDGLDSGLSRVLRAQGKFAEAEAVLAKAAWKAKELADDARERSDPEAALEALLWRIGVYWEEGNINQAELALGEALEVASRSTPSAPLPDRLSFVAMKHAALQLWFGMEAEHSALSRRMIRWAANQPRFAPKGRAAAMLNLRQVNDRQLQTDALALARFAVESAPTNALLVWYRLTLGVAEYRLGHYPEAEPILLGSEQWGPEKWHPSARTCTSMFFRAMMLFRQNQEAQARQLFAEAEAKMTPLPAFVQWSLNEGADYDELMLWLAYKEARALLNPPPK